MEKEMQSPRPMADLVFVNGQVITMDGSSRICQGVAISGNQIIHVGTSEEAILYAGHDTRVVDLQGKTLLPGFIDSHYHPILNGLFGLDEEAAIIDISSENCPSIEDILTLVRKATANRPPGTWISMMGYNQNSIAENRHLIREELDKAAPNHPVQCMHISGHISIYNSQALATIGVFSPIDAARYPQNEIEVHSGRLTGLVYDHTHFLLWSKVGYTEQQQYDAAMKSNDLLLRFGFLRYVLPLYPEQAYQYAGILALLAVLAIIFGALASFGQTDFKRLVAYSSVNHMGFVVLGIAAAARSVGTLDANLALNGAVLQMFNHGLSAAGMFFLVGVLYERTHTRDLREYGGLFPLIPVYGGILIFTAMASLGLPGLNGFISEFLVVRGSWPIFNLFTALAMFGLLMTGAYILKALKMVLHGPMNTGWSGHLSEIGAREIFVITPLLVLILWIGVWPCWILDLINQAVAMIFGA